MITKLISCRDKSSNTSYSQHSMPYFINNNVTDTQWVENFKVIKYCTAKNNQKWFLNRLEVSQHVCCLFMRQACSTYFNAASIDVVNQPSDCQSRHAVQLNPLLATFTQCAVKHGAEVRWARGQHCAVAQNFSVASHKHCVCTAHLNRMYFPESTARSLLYYYYTHLTAPFQKNLEPDLQNILQFSVRLS